MSQAGTTHSVGDLVVLNLPCTLTKQQEIDELEEREEVCASWLYTVVVGGGRSGPNFCPKP